jgi:hypothetical protein
MKGFSVVGNFLLGSLFTLLLVSEFSFKENAVKSVAKGNQLVSLRFQSRSLLPQKRFLLTASM